MRALAVVVLLVLGARSARAGGAEELAEARRLKQQLDFAGALAAVERAIAAGDNDAAQLRAAYALAGELAAGLGRAAEATAHFERLLSIDPGAALPAGTSPKIRAPFEQARARAQPLAAHVEHDARGIRIVVDRDPLGLVAAGRARWAAGESTGGLAFPVGPGEAYVASLLDAHGNTLLVIHGRTAAPSRAARALWARPALWGAAAAVLAAGAGVAAWRTDVAQDEWNRLRDEGTHDFTELRAVEDRGRRDALVANVALGAAALAATVGAVLWIRDDVGVTTDGATVALAGRF